MKKRGISLIEIMIALSILSIIAAASLGFYYTNKRAYKALSNSVDDSVNVRIALEYFFRRIINSNNVSLIEKKDGIEIEADEITVNSVNNNLSYIYIDGDKIFIFEDIIRCNQKSEHVVSGIKSFTIKKNGEGTYFIKVTSENFSQSTKVSRRK